MDRKNIPLQNGGMTWRSPQKDPWQCSSRHQAIHLIGKPFQIQLASFPLAWLAAPWISLDSPPSLMDISTLKRSLVCRTFLPQNRSGQPHCLAFLEINFFFLSDSGTDLIISSPPASAMNRQLQQHSSCSRTGMHSSITISPKYGWSSGKNARG